MIWSGLRPNPAAWVRISSRNAFIAATLPAEAMIVSAQRAAKVRPRGEPPAWQITGWPCGDRGAESGPRERKYLPSWKTGRTFAGSAKISCLLVDHHRVGVPGVPELLHHLHKLVGHVVALVVRELPFVAEVLGAAVVAAGDEVPAGASVADMVQRVGQPGEQERIIFGGGQGGDDADPLMLPGS